MDITLNSRRGSSRTRKRNFRAWSKNFSNTELGCRYCQHDNRTHLVLSGQPHFRTADGRRRIVARSVEIIRAFCTACADEIGTSQVLCYHRTTAVGERLPLR